MSQKNTVLVVDDSTSNLLGLQKILEKENYKVLTTARGDQALDLLRSNNIDVVLLDLMMPDLSGFDVLGEMQADKLICNIPVIIISARSNSKDIKQALDNGAVDYIKKPIDIVELLARINAALRLKSKKSSISILENHQLKGIKMDLLGTIEKFRISNNKLKAGLPNLNDESRKTHEEALKNMEDIFTFVEDFMKLKLG